MFDLHPHEFALIHVVLAIFGAGSLCVWALSRMYFYFFGERPDDRNDTPHNAHHV